MTTGKKPSKKPAKKTTAKKKSANSVKRKAVKISKNEADDVTLVKESTAPISLVGQLLDYTGLITHSLIDVAKAGSAIPLMYSDNWLKDLYIRTIDPKRLNAMADAGTLLKDTREVAGLSLDDLSNALGLKDNELLREVESGRATLPFDIILRITSLIARHDPVPFILEFVRTYNPDLEKHLEDWGVAALPKNFERERRMLNLYRQHDVLREFSDETFERLLNYQGKALEYALAVMNEEHSISKTKD